MAAERDLRELVAELRTLGLGPGRDLLIHSSLRQVGQVSGGAGTVLCALRQAAGVAATIVVPAYTEGNSRTSRTFLAETAGMTPDRRAKYIASMPGFDPLVTPSQHMGRLAEYVRTRPGAMRSGHPQSSFTAIGYRSAECVSSHPLECHLGQSSPLGWLYRADAMVLLLGVGYSACSAFHLAEYLLPGKRPARSYNCFVMEQAVRRERVFVDLDLVDSDFAAVGLELDQQSFVRRGRVGAAECRLLLMRKAVDFAVAWPPFRERRAVR